MLKETLLSYFPKITSRRYQQLVAIFSSLDDAWVANKDELLKTGWKVVLQKYKSRRDDRNQSVFFCRPYGTF